MNVSVALPTYNGEPYLDEQLSSIFNQSRVPDEVIVCDDRSTDGTMETLAAYESRYPNRLHITQNDETLGIQGNFERCIERCSSDVIALCDQDDVWLPEKIERQLSAVRATNATLVFHDSEITTELLEQVASHWELCGYRHGDVRTPDGALDELFRTCFVKGSSIMFRRELCKYALPFAGPWPHDYFLAMNAAITGKLYDIDDQLHQYRRHDSQNSPSRSRSLRAKVNNAITSFGNTAFNRRIEMWSTFISHIDQIPQEDLRLPKAKIVSQFKDRCQFDRNRKYVYDRNNPRWRRLGHVGQNLRHRRYQAYGKRSFSPWLYIAKDTAVALL